MTPRRSISRQQGATLVMVALWMGIALAALMVLDIGHLFWQKRELQKIADIAAVAGASGPLSQCGTSAVAVAHANGLRQVDPPARTHAGTWSAKTSFDGFAGTALKNACGIQVSRVVPYFFVWPAQAGSARTLWAEAIAVQRPPELAQLFIRNKVLDIATGKPNAILLNAVVGGLLGGSLNLSALSWEGLLRADVQLLKVLEALKLSLKVGSYQEVLNKELSLLALVDAMVVALQQGDGPAVGANVSALEVIGAAVQVPALKLTLAQLLRLDLSGADAGVDARLNVFGLLQSVVQVANKNSALAADLRIPLGGLADVALKLKVVEPPQWALGRPEQNPPLRASTAQVQLGLDTKVLGIGVKLDVTAGSGSVTLKSYSCQNATDKSLVLDVKSALLSLNLKLTLLNKDVLHVPLQVLAQTKNASVTPPRLTQVSKAPPSDLDADAWQKIVFDAGIVNSLLDSIKETVQETLKSSLGVLGALLGGLLGGILDLVNLVLSPLLDPILSLLLSVLGIDLTATEFAGQLSCGDYRATLVH